MQPSVALSSMESEYMAASAAAQEAMWMNRLLQQLGFKTSRPITLYEDNKAAIFFADHPGDYRRSKHIDTLRYFVWEAVTNGEIELVYVNTEDQPADWWDDEGVTTCSASEVSGQLSVTLCVSVNLWSD